MSKKPSHPDGKAKISINIPDRLLNELDLDRKDNKLDRSSWITSAIMEKLASIRKEKEIEENNK
jgi:metal-responsive CopG/Arc/MetJ family transcriptional regulator